MTPDSVIVVQDLSKTYQVSEREGGFAAAVRSFFKRKHRDVQAVRQVSFRIGPGEVVGFLGPNGAGKTTTLKMLSGLLHPSRGDATVLGFTPWQLKPEYLRAMTLVMGQRNRLSWDIPAADSSTSTGAPWPSWTSCSTSAPSSRNPCATSRSASA
jgi:ABC-2 type transport system ATP-binding protein